eukprot:TRINITY_DN9026_c0_g1_i6.p1 TRINITY_DN9026_c0_g1~~TRINITY_DN9026_c0_g1_i6.p1  ORF type:complete len:240 (-),score=15.21 TRINITY_DN9026_c0_g1_i6:131-850(-)
MGEAFVPINARMQQDQSHGDIELQDKPDHMTEEEAIVAGDASHKKRHRCFCEWQTWMCWACGLFGLLLTIIGIGALVFMTTVKMEPPKLYVDRIDIQNLALNPDFLNLQLTLTALIKVTATVFNPNKFDINVKYLNMLVQFFDVPVSSTSLPGFWLNAGKNSTMTVSFPIDSVPLITASNSGNVILDAFRSGKLQMKVSLAAGHGVRFRLRVARHDAPAGDSSRILQQHGGRGVLGEAR